MSLSSVYLKLILLGALITALGAFHYIDKGYALSQQEKLSKARIELAVKEAEKRTKETEKELASSALKGEQDKNEKLKSNNDKLSATIVSLQQRPTRTISNPSIATVVQACTGRELFREDGEFLAREASRADEVVIERDFYYEQYERARTILAKQGTNDR